MLNFIPSRYVFPGFSLSDWYKKVSVPVGSFLTATHLSLLREALGITNFLLPKDQQCSRMSSDYKPETSGQLGWKIGNLYPMSHGGAK